MATTDRPGSALVRSLLTLGGLGAACVAYGTFVERRWYRIRHVTVPSGQRRGLRILHLSDVHHAPPDPALEAFVSRLASETYDLVVATGDLLGARHAERPTAELLGRLVEDVPGVVVYGSNDVYAPAPKSPLHYFTRGHERVHGDRLDLERFTESLTEVGFHVLRNETAVIDTSAGPVAVGGIDDPHLNPRTLPARASLTPPDVGAVLRLGVVHAPYVSAVDLLADADYELILAGHTHGGQVRIPPFGALVNNCDLPLDRSRGLSAWRDAWLHVSPGLGTSTYAPFRFACRPEATILAW